MLYIATALEASAITHSITIPNFTSNPNSTNNNSSRSLVVAKGKIIEVWDIKPEGLVKSCETDVWGMVVGLEWVGNVEAGEQPHIVVLTDHPLSRLLLYHYLPSTDVSSSPETITGTLELSSSHWISSLSQPAEFLTGLVADHEAGICVASLYSGILNVVEIGVEDDDDDDGEGEESGRSKRNRAGKGKGNGKGKRKEIVDEDIEMKTDVDQGRGTGKAKWGPMVFKEKYEINIREFNLLSLAFLSRPPPIKKSEPSSLIPGPTSTSSILTFLYLTPDYDIQLIARSLDRPNKAFVDISPVIDVVLPPIFKARANSTSSSGNNPRSKSSSSKTLETFSNKSTADASKDFSVPAAKRLLALPNAAGVLVIGDEFSASYSLSNGSTKDTRRSFSFHSQASDNMKGREISTNNSKQLSAQSPDTSKRRKASTGGSFVPSGITGGGNGDADGLVGGGGGKMSWRRGWRVRQGFGDITGATAIECEPSSGVVLLGDSYGRLTMIEYNQSSLNSAVAHLLGVTSSPSSISYLDSAYVFIASQTGDSTVIQLDPTSLMSSKNPATPSKALTRPNAKAIKQQSRSEDAMQIDEEEIVGQDKGKAFDVVDNWTNIGPVLDFTVVKEEGGDDSQIVTASGFGSSGSLRVIRSGVGLEELFTLEGLEEVTGIFPISSSSITGVMLTAADSTTFLRFEGDQEESFNATILSPSTDFPYIDSEVTLATGWFQTESVVQVTPSGVYLSIIGDTRLADSWKSNGVEIVHAALTDRGALIGLKDGSLRYIEAREGSLSVKGSWTAEVPGSSSEIACMDAFMQTDDQPGIAVVGRWESNSIDVLILPDLILSERKIIEKELPTALRLRQTNAGMQLCVGLGNGSLVSYTLTGDIQTDAELVADRKEMSLGRLPITLSPKGSKTDATEMLIALSDRASILFEEQGRLSYSAMKSKDIIAASVATCPPLGEVLLTVTKQGLNISRITSVKNLQIRKVDLGYDIPFGVGHHKQSRTYCVAINRVSLEQEYGNEERNSLLRLYDDATLAPIAEIPLDSGEIIVALNPITLHGEDLFAVSTVFPKDPDDSGAAAHGNIRLIAIVPSPNHDQHASLSIRVTRDMLGNVHDCKEIWGYLAVAVDHKVELFLVNFEADESLQRISSWGSAFQAECLSVQTYKDDIDGKDKQRLHVGDGMRSVFALELETEDESKILTDVGRDMKPHWVLTMAELEAEGGAVILSDMSYNVLTIRHKDNQLENAAAFALHENVTKFHKGSIAPPSGNESAFNPELLFATSSGRLGIVAELGSDESRLLSDLQRNMEGFIRGPDVDWRKYREVHTEGTAKPRATVGFIDGDYVQQFLTTKVDPNHLMRGENDATRIIRPSIGGTTAIGSRLDIVKTLEAAAALH